MILDIAMYYKVNKVSKNINLKYAHVKFLQCLDVHYLDNVGNIFNYNAKNESSILISLGKAKFIFK